MVPAGSGESSELFMVENLNLWHCVFLIQEAAKVTLIHSTLKSIVV